MSAHDFPNGEIRARCGFLIVLDKTSRLPYSCHLNIAARNNPPPYGSSKIGHSNNVR